MRRLSPNMITLFRIGLIPVFVAALLTRIPNGTVIAFAVFAVAAASDGLDGYIARSRNRITVLGVFLDPLADKLLITAALVSLVQLQRISAWVALLIISREVMVTGLRALAAAKGDVIAASWLGKAKTTAQIFLVLALIPLETPQLVVNVALVLAVAFTLLSGIDYFWKGRAYLRDAPPADSPDITIKS